MTEAKGIEAALMIAVVKAIESMGMSEFKKCSFFMSNWKST